MHHVRKVPVAAWIAWAVTVDLSGTEHQASEEDLLNRGMVVLHDDGAHVWVDCAVVDWRERTDLPGSVVSEGFGVPRGGRPSRFDLLPARVRTRVLQARVRRGSGGRRSAAAMPELVAIDEVRADDLVEDAVMPPHRWHV